MVEQDVDFENQPDWELQYAASTRAFHTLHVEEGELRRKLALLEIESAKYQQQRDLAQLDYQKALSEISQYRSLEDNYIASCEEVEDLIAQIDGLKNQLGTISQYLLELRQELEEDYEHWLDDDVAFGIAEQYASLDEGDEVIEEGLVPDDKSA